MVTETKTTHTAGPWTVAKTSPHECDDIRAQPFTIRAPLGAVPHGHMGDYRGNIVAVIEQNGSDPLPGLAEANARVIAAAPDLLAALNLICQNYGPAREDFLAGDTGERGYQEACAVFNLAEVAIAKAEGR